MSTNASRSKAGTKTEIVGAMLINVDNHLLVDIENLAHQYVRDTQGR